ncbi:MAG: stage III sporulation protein AC [Clostridia bacterium]|jgi:stage III sporulation protein AC|nr:stage III sporulation protein AC [Clostridia bacterium]
MQIDLIFKVAGVGVIVAVLNLLLTRSGREEQGMMTTLAGLIVVIMVIIKEIGNVFTLIRSTFGF